LVKLYKNQDHTEEILGQISFSSHGSSACASPAVALHFVQAAIADFEKPPSLPPKLIYYYHDDNK